MDGYRCSDTPRGYVCPRCGVVHADTSHWKRWILVIVGCMVLAFIARIFWAQWWNRTAQIRSARSGFSDSSGIVDYLTGLVDRGINNADAD